MKVMLVSTCEVHNQDKMDTKWHHITPEAIINFNNHGVKTLNSLPCTFKDTVLLKTFEMSCKNK